MSLLGAFDGRLARCEQAGWIAGSGLGFAANVWGCSLGVSTMRGHAGW
jgi:hypothetical protein